MLTMQAFENLTARIKSDVAERYQGANPRIVAVTPLREDHPDRHCVDTEYVGTVKVHYDKRTHNNFYTSCQFDRDYHFITCKDESHYSMQTWEIVYGITSTGDIHTWVD